MYTIAYHNCVRSGKRSYVGDDGGLIYTRTNVFLAIEQPRGRSPDGVVEVWVDCTQCASTSATWKLYSESGLV